MRGASQPGMDAGVLLASRARRLAPLRPLSDPLLLALVSHSDPIPDRVASGVVLFSPGEYASFWYLLLAGEVQLFLAQNRKRPIVLRTLHAGCLFGELDVSFHTCAAVISRPAEFIKIAQGHFVSLYNKHADHLQSHIVIMQDLIAEQQVGQQQFDEWPPPPPNGLPLPQSNGFSSSHPVDLPPGEYRDPYDMNLLRSELPTTEDPYQQTNIFEFNSMSVEARIFEAGTVLRYTFLSQAPHLVRERTMHGKVYPGCMAGKEMVDWLLEVAISFGSQAQKLSRFQITGIWQTLLENNIICHVTNEQQFLDKHVFYRWVEDSGARNGSMTLSEEPPTREDISNAVFFLSTIGPDALFRMILGKATHDRTPEELSLVYDEILHVKALSHLSTMVKRELATVIGFEHRTHAGTVLFHQGDPGKSWYIILKGSVDVSIHGKGVVCTLQEGDDFGKLALVNDSPRAATITLSEDNAQFLVVDKYDFNRIIRDVEANTVRLKEHGQDVMVLEKISWPSGAAVDQHPGKSKSHCCYSVMAGLPEKMIEYVLETRVDAHTDDGEMDVFLEDFILTHIIYLPTNVLCNYLKNYYRRRTHLPQDSSRAPCVSTAIDFEVDMEYCVLSRRRVVSFLHIWVNSLGLQFFLDPAANSFVEELYCHVLEDHRRIPGLSGVLHRMALIRQLREDAMRTLARHPCVVLECGVSSSSSPAPLPVLPSDTCNQIIHLSDTTSFVMSVRMDKTAREICELARVRMRNTQTNESLRLVEVKSSGEKTVFAPNDVSISTALSINSKLYVVSVDEVDSLGAMGDQNGPVESVHASVLEYVSSSELAEQLSILHSQLFEACDEIELIVQVIGREQFPGRVVANLDLLIRRFNEVQCWATTEVLLATAARRVNTLRKFIKIAMYAKENRDLLSFFAITLGLSNVAVSRLSATWQRLPAKQRRQFAEFESLLDPSRNHRPYRALVAKMSPPLIPFIPLILKDLTFIHEGNKTYFNGLVNFEKMHMMANTLRAFRQCKSRFSPPLYESKKVFDTLNLMRNFRVIENQCRLMELSCQIEPRRRRN